jgi:hypothetical protein
MRFLVAWDPRLLGCEPGFLAVDDGPRTERGDGRRIVHACVRHPCRPSLSWDGPRGGGGRHHPVRMTRAARSQHLYRAGATVRLLLLLPPRPRVVRGSLPCFCSS